MEAGRSGVVYNKIIEVDGETYKISALPPSRAFKLGAKLAKFVGEPLAAMAGLAGNTDQATDILPKAVKSLMNNLDEDAVLKLIKELMLSCEYEGKMMNESLFELHFQGRLGHMMELLLKIVEFQFNEFFQKIGTAITGVSSEVLKTA